MSIGPERDTKINYYAILKIDQNADAQIIRKQYLRLALQYHPDRNPGQEDKYVQLFQQLQLAHEVLGDPSKKRVYDSLYHEVLRNTRTEGRKTKTTPRKSTGRASNASNQNSQSYSGRSAYSAYNSPKGQRNNSPGNKNKAYSQSWFNSRGKNNRPTSSSSSGSPNSRRTGDSRKNNTSTKSPKPASSYSYVYQNRSQKYDPHSGIGIRTTKTEPAEQTKENANPAAGSFDPAASKSSNAFADDNLNEDDVPPAASNKGFAANSPEPSSNPAPDSSFNPFEIPKPESTFPSSGIPPNTDNPFAFQPSAASGTSSSRTRLRQNRSRLNTRNQASTKPESYFQTPPRPTNSFPSADAENANFQKFSQQATPEELRNSQQNPFFFSPNAFSKQEPIPSPPKSFQRPAESRRRRPGNSKHPGKTDPEVISNLDNLFKNIDLSATPGKVSLPELPQLDVPLPPDTVPSMDDLREIGNYMTAMSVYQIKWCKYAMEMNQFIASWNIVKNKVINSGTVDWSLFPDLAKHWSQYNEFCIAFSKQEVQHFNALKTLQWIRKSAMATQT
ncbi:meiotically upregulated Mug184 [Schizosaccharomyces japonicus yFS275]|uniref:Meiotically upregulated Mug184 n=1 Tax=Schizosaccharomyces japonicus (strain yFS275 / FY16936) TaxID=402676 RepID=B6K2Q2_SCHJY|nr:meiotically upregulated Mug184 [Schizosaccharomyces japonicus yFS275]EEB07433.1 meiotically upregulated Mug184 [Schizosaccharomyces japonicus yFS275]